MISSNPLISFANRAHKLDRIEKVLRHLYLDRRATRVLKNLSTAMVNSDKCMKINNIAISREYLFFIIFLQCTFLIPERAQENSTTVMAARRRHLNLKIGKDRDKQRLSQIGSSAFASKMNQGPEA